MKIEKNNWQNIIKNKNFIYYGLKLLSLLFSLIVRIRNLLYDLSILNSKRVQAFVVSIGNITVGGTGKTPTVEYLANFFTGISKKTAIVSRGYKSRSEKSKTRIITNGKELLMNEYESGDEPYMLALRLKKIPVIINKNRYSAGKYAVEKFDCEIIVLDDAYQHRQIYRNLNILLIDSNNPFGNYNILPAGELREPLSAINRADIVLITKIDEDKNHSELIKKINKHSCHNIPIFQTKYEKEYLKTLVTDEIKDFSFCANKNILLVCGIGNPDVFKKMVKNISVKGINMITFPDHHEYNTRDIMRIKAAANMVDIVITTQKDAVKLKNFSEQLLPVKNIFYLTITLKVFEEKKFHKLIIEKLDNQNQL